MNRTDLTPIADRILSLLIITSLVAVPLPLVQAQDAPALYPLDEIQLLRGDLHEVEVSQLERVSITDPDIADISDADADSVTVIAKQAGQTVLFIWDSKGKRNIVVRVIDEELGLVKARVEYLLRSAGIEGVTVEESPYEGKVIVSGKIRPYQQLDYEKIIEPFADRVVNVASEELGDDLIQIDMQITELNTTLNKNMGILWGNATNGSDNNDLFFNFPETLPDQDGSIGDLFKIGDFHRTSAILATVNLLVERGEGRILSKPRLVVVSGKEASFLVGGEIPIKSTTIDSTGGGTITENVTFKEYGVSMNITPALRKGKIDILLNVQISDIDAANAVGSDVAFITREAETNLYLDDGQTIVLAGLIKKNTSETVKKVPILGDIPFLGALFRNKRNPAPNSETELVISLTPRVISKKAGETVAQKPAPIQVQSQKSPADMSGRTVYSTREEKPVISKSAQTTHVPVAEDKSGYVQNVQRRISEAISYPFEAQEKGWEGVVKLRLVVLRNGMLDEVTLLGSSGYETFDRDAVNTARILSPFEPFPAEITEDNLEITVPIVYSQRSYLDNVVNRPQI